MFEVVAARDLGPQFITNPHRMVGQDGAYSIPMRDGALWFFGDTLIGRRVPGESLWYPGGVPVGHVDMSGKGSIDRMLNNTALILRESDGRNGLRNFEYVCDQAGNLRQLIPLEPDEDPDWVRIWCLHGVAFGEQIYLYFIKVWMLEEGPFPVNFRVVGSGIAVGDRKSMTFRRVSRGGTSILWGEHDPHFATAVLRDESGWVYLYGSRQILPGGQRCSLARVREEEIADYEGYEYLESSVPTWNRSVSKAMDLFAGMPNEMSVSFNPYLRQYLAVHSLDLSGQIVGRTAPAPWGPWSDPILLWTVHPVRDRVLPYPPLIYAGKEHPELSTDGGRALFITYIEFEEYFPHLVEVTLGNRTSG